MLRLLALILTALALVACGAQPAQPIKTTMAAKVDGIQVTLLESNPVQAEVRILGELGDGCMSLGQITQRREGNVIVIDVPAIRTQADACTMILQMIDERVMLDGTFGPGEYTVRVNGIETTFTI